MFSFFSEVIEFLSQVVFNSNYVSDFLGNIISSGSESIVFIGKFSSSFPSTFAWILPAALVVLIFDFVRGR